MWVQPFHSAARELFPPKEAEEFKVALLLNANARKMTRDMVRRLSHGVAEKDLFVSRSELDCHRIAQTVLDRRYDTVFLGGGDGTFMGFVNAIMGQIEQRRRRQAPTPIPRFGVLKLGTGNALATWVNASSTRNDAMLDDVLKARAGEGLQHRRLDLMMVEGRRAQFAGLGLDGRVLNDFIWVKENLGKGPLSALMTGGAGYFTSVALKTVPYYFTHSTKVGCEIINEGTTAYRCGPDGAPVQTFKPGEVIYRGPVMMCAASTIPYYGYGLKMFPFATRRAGLMNLRFGTASPVDILANLKGLWNGTWFPPNLHDVLCSDVQVRLEKPMSFQVAGDACGDRTDLRFSVAREPLEVVDFNSSVN